MKGGSPQQRVGHVVHANGLKIGLLRQLRLSRTRVIGGLLVFLLATAIACSGDSEQMVQQSLKATPADTPEPTQAAVTPEPTQVITPESIRTSTPLSIDEAGEMSTEEFRSTKERAEPSASDATLEELARGNSAFAFDLYAALASEEGNLFFSPYSISLALAMTYAGARGETERQMAEVLHFLPQDLHHDAFNALDLELASRSEVEEGESEGNAFKLSIANAIWGHSGYEFLQPFLDTLAESYGAGVQAIDFEASPEGARKTINDWVARQTEDRIKDLIPTGMITELTRIVLANAIYFNATWRYPFDEGETRRAPFFLLDGSTKDVPMMSYKREPRLLKR